MTSLAPPGIKPVPTPAVIFAACCAAAGVVESDALARSSSPRIITRAPGMVRLRAVCAALCRRHTIASFPEIALAMGSTAHNTAIGAKDRFRRTVGTDPQTADLFHRVESSLAESYLLHLGPDRASSAIPNRGSWTGPARCSGASVPGARSRRTPPRSRSSCSPR